METEHAPQEGDFVQMDRPGSIPPDIMADIQAVADAAAAGKPLDPEVTRRVRERSAKVQAELRRQYGVREIAVELIRQGRDEG
jgi:hypothetical protein